MDFRFFINSALLGVGLAMDAFSVSMANGLASPKMNKKTIILISFTFAFFQALMPLLGWFFVHTFVNRFAVFEKFIPWIALLLLGFIGGKMLYEGIIKKCEECVTRLTFTTLLLQGVATSIDALSVGFTISEYNFSDALCSALIIAAVTFIICVAGVIIGKKVGTRLQNKASILGGTILVAIGIEIFISGLMSL